MKYSEAIKVAMNDAAFAHMVTDFEKSVRNIAIAGSVQFAIGDEAFYYAGEAIYDEANGTYEYKFRGGKHTPRRAAYLIDRGQTYIIK